MHVRGNLGPMKKGLSKRMNAPLFVEKSMINMVLIHCNSNLLLITSSLRAIHKHEINGIFA